MMLASLANHAGLNIHFRLTEIQHTKFSQNPESKNGFLVFKVIRILIERDMLVMEWKSSPTADSYADSVLSTILRIDSNAGRITKNITSSGEEACKAKFHKQLGILLESMYGGQIESTSDESEFLFCFVQTQK